LTETGPQRIERVKLHDSKRRRNLLPRQRLRVARAALLWERLWPALMPATALGGLFLALALSDLLPDLDGYLHAGLLAGFALAFLGLLYRGLRGFVWPSEAAARRRIELSSRLAHRPLEALQDSLVGGRGDPTATRLWDLHRQRLEASIGQLKVGLPRPGLASHDPYALRGVVVLLLAVALFGGWSDSTARIERALEPSFAAGPPPAPPRLDVWVTPPAYTGEAPIFLAAVDPKAGPFKAPVGSDVLAQVQGGDGATELALGEASTKFDSIGEGTFRATGKILTGNRLAVVGNGSVIAAWPYTLIQDQPPIVGFTRSPSETERHSLRLDYAASDDYSVAKVEVVITRRNATSEVPAAPGQPNKIVIELPGPGADPRTAHGVAFRDLTPHPWAGTPVRLQLFATDAIGQQGLSQPFDMVLPAREFHHPVAKAIIEQRRQLTLEPESRVAVGRRLLAIGNETDAYAGDPVVTLALRIGGRRLMLDKTGADLPGVQDLLWQTALRLEEGGIASAEEALRQAEQALQDALDRGASDQEVQRLMDQLQQAMNQFLDQLMQQAQQDAAKGGHQMPDPHQLALQRGDLQRMLDRAREMAKGGARDAARQMLSQLQEMLENLRANPYAGQMDQGARQAQQMMRDLGDLAQRQQQLLDKTYRQSQQLAPGQAAPDQSGSADEQSKIRGDLENLTGRLGMMLGKVPDQLSDADRSMGLAEGDLRAGDPNGAVQPETQALQSLQQGAQSMMQALAERFGRKPGDRSGPGQDQFGQSQDPLGRNLPGLGQVDTGDVKLPDKSDLQRARQILDELRRRAGDPGRPRYELDYLDRLLKRF
jgi:uncharacterized protein (TIGR02302 family)